MRVLFTSMGCCGGVVSLEGLQGRFYGVLKGV